MPEKIRNIDSSPNGSSYLEGPVQWNYKISWSVIVCSLDGCVIEFQLYWYLEHLKSPKGNDKQIFIYRCDIFININPTILWHIIMCVCFYFCSIQLFYNIRWQYHNNNYYYVIIDHHVNIPINFLLNNNH